MSSGPLPPHSILVLNAGSTSLKAGLFLPSRNENFAHERAILTAEINDIGAAKSEFRLLGEDGDVIAKEFHSIRSPKQALKPIAKAIAEHCPGATPLAIAHRVVHGGPYLRTHTEITPEVLSTLDRSKHFAPLHVPKALELIRETTRVFRNTRQFACFDTEFHRDIPEAHSTLPLPKIYREQGVRLYGFHGLSYDSIVRQIRLPQGSVPERVIAAHLGGGSSLCAIYRGRSIDTTMSFTPSGGLPMATRSGDLDPSVLLFLARQEKLSTSKLEQLINHQCGLAAISGMSGDMRELQKLAKAKSGARKKAAALAIQIYTTSIAQSVASLIVSLGGIDLLVFSGGIGEHSAEIRAHVLENLAPLGFAFDRRANLKGVAVLSTKASIAPVQIIQAQEDLVIAQETRRLLRSSPQKYTLR